MKPNPTNILAKKKDKAFLNDTRIANHKMAAEHLQAAVRYHLAAAKFYESGDSVNGAENSLKAQGFMHMAFEEQAANAKFYALHC
jgi:hypothetical protein